MKGQFHPHKLGEMKNANHKQKEDTTGYMKRGKIAKNTLKTLPAHPKQGR